MHLKNWVWEDMAETDGNVKASEDEMNEKL